MTTTTNTRTASITISWRAFTNRTSTSLVLVFPDTTTDADILERVYHATNTGKGELWAVLQSRLPVPRSHTALMVGDAVTIDSTSYLCAPVGWTECEHPIEQWAHHFGSRVSPTDWYDCNACGALTQVG